MERISQLAESGTWLFERIIAINPPAKIKEYLIGVT
jgi:hypothetical protein